jgi:hypothetical protein
VRTAMLLLFIVAGAGCLASPSMGPSTSSDAAATVTPQTKELRSFSVFTPTPGTQTFTVDVPPGGATDVTWRLELQGASSFESYVSGHGCSQQGFFLQGGPDTVRQGKCSDLPAGRVTFTVNLADPAVSFTATITGTVLS